MVFYQPDKGFLCMSRNQSH